MWIKTGTYFFVLLFMDDVLVLAARGAFSVTNNYFPDMRWEKSARFLHGPAVAVRMQAMAM